MTFYGTGQVWSAEKKAIIADFKNGETEITDKKDIELLKALDYKYSGEEPQDDDGETLKALRDRAKEAGITNVTRKDRETLLAELGE